MDRNCTVNEVFPRERHGTTDTMAQQWSGPLRESTAEISATFFIG